MPASEISEVIRHLRSAAARAEGPGRTDAQILERFVSRRDPAALEVLVRRHGPMVWGVCRRILGHHHDAEDAFQATFLVLVRRAAGLRPREAVGNWLYGVAHQTALKALASRAKRRMREAQPPTIPEPAAAEPDPASDLCPLLDRELSRLPDKYRAVLVLCDLEGRTRQEAARCLGCPAGTVGSRLARARALLARRLARHGLAVSGGALAALLAREASAAVPASVLSATVNALTAVAAGRAVAGAVSLPVAALTEGVLKAMSLTKLRAAVAGLLLAAALVAALVAGAGLVGRAAARTAPPPAPPPRQGATERSRLEGDWTVVAVHRAGAVVKNDPALGSLVSFKGDTVSWPKGPSPFSRKIPVSYRLDPGAGTRHIDFVFHFPSQLGELVDGKLQFKKVIDFPVTMMCLYALDGDELKINGPSRTVGGPRPTGWANGRDTYFLRRAPAKPGGKVPDPVPPPFTSLPPHPQTPPPGPPGVPFPQPPPPLQLGPGVHTVRVVPYLGPRGGLRAGSLLALRRRRHGGPAAPRGPGSPCRQQGG